MKPRTLTSQWGNVTLSLETEQLLSINGDTDNAVFWAGYGAAYLHLWQLDLSRRVASGRYEVMGNGALRTDIFQRRLGLVELAKWQSLTIKCIAR